MNFSDRFLAKISGTDPYGGNDPNKVAQILRKEGVVFQSRWDVTEDIDSVEKFYADIPKNVLEMAKEDFDYNFGHQWVLTGGETKEQRIELMKDALRYSVLGVAVTAWYEGDGGVYIDRGQRNNHWCVCYGWDDEKQAWKIFDSYDNFRKLYSYDSLISVAKRYTIEKKIPKPLGGNWITDLFTRLISFFKDLLPCYN